jgi:perosamine synthetase
MNKIIWWEPQIGKKEYEYISLVFKNNFPNEGKLTKEFEKNISDLLKVKHVIMVNNATSAMFLTLKALGIGNGDEVIVPNLTFIATANAVEMAGAKTVLVDVKKENVTIDIEKMVKAITPKTKAVMPVHVSGRPADLVSIKKALKGKNIFIIEDAAEAFMSMYKGKYLGTFGEAGCFSLSPAKTITTGQGGFIATNKTKLYTKIVEIKDQGRPKRGT